MGYVSLQEGSCFTGLILGKPYQLDQGCSGWSRPATVAQPENSPGMVDWRLVDQHISRSFKINSFEICQFATGSYTPALTTKPK